MTTLWRAKEGDSSSYSRLMVQTPLSVEGQQLTGEGKRENIRIVRAQDREERERTRKRNDRFVLSGHPPLEYT